MLGYLASQEKPEDADCPFLFESHCIVRPRMVTSHAIHDPSFIIPRFSILGLSALSNAQKHLALALAMISLSQGWMRSSKLLR